jgi:hypothetical protein
MVKIIPTIRIHHPSFTYVISFLYPLVFLIFLVRTERQADGRMYGMVSLGLQCYTNVPQKGNRREKA